MIKHRLKVLNLAALTAMATAGSAMAAGVVANGGQTQVNTVGNTPVVNIAGPNNSGISRNTFSNFDVDRNGVVFNNLTAAGSSRLAGQLAANANLQGNAAKVIVADVSSAQASKLNGAMEVAGAPAHVLIANAAGVSANGVSTINVPMLTLAAAAFNPRADSPLALSVDTTRATPATIRIDGEGVDAGAGQLNLLSRATVVNGAVKGWSINSQNGTDFDGDANGNFAGKLAYTSAAAGQKPGVALDVSELGGMYANKIVLEGSEYGLGVNNAGLIKGGEGSIAIQMFGADIQNAPNSVVATNGYSAVSRVKGNDASYVLQDADHMQREMVNFQQQKQVLKTAVDNMNAARGWTPEVEAKLTYSDKLARLSDLMKEGQQEFANEPARNAALADERAKADATRQVAQAQALAEQEAREREQQQADAQRQAAEQQARAEYEARMEHEARERAQQQADAARMEQEARERAQQQADAQHQPAEQQARADYEARMEQQWYADYQARMLQQARDYSDQQQAIRDLAAPKAQANVQSAVASGYGF